MVKYTIAEALKKVGYGIRMPNTGLVVFAPVVNVGQFHEYALKMTPTPSMLSEGSCVYSFVFGPFDHVPYVDLSQNSTLLKLVGAMFALKGLTPESLIIHEFSMRTYRTCGEGDLHSPAENCTFNTLENVREFIKHGKAEELLNMELHIHFSVRHSDTFMMTLGQQQLESEVSDTFAIDESKEGLPITHAFTGCFECIR
jgi:hypothetical protein